MPASFSALSSCATTDGDTASGPAPCSSPSLRRARASTRCSEATAHDVKVGQGSATRAHVRVYECTRMSLLPYTAKEGELRTGYLLAHRRTVMLLQLESTTICRTQSASYQFCKNSNRIAGPEP